MNNEDNTSTFNQIGLDPKEVPTFQTIIEKVTPLERFIRNVIQEEFDKRFNSTGTHVFLDEESGKVSTVIELCRRCKEKIPSSSTGYCEECQEVVDERDSLMRDYEARKKKI